MEIPEARYAKTPDGVHIAYRVMGDRPLDLVYISGGFADMETSLENPAIASTFERILRFARVVTFDRRGLGASDRFPALPTLEHQVDDVIAVLDAVGARDAAIYGTLTGGSLALLLAAAHPGRCRAVITHAAFPRLVRGPDWPVGVEPEEWEEVIRAIESGDAGPLMKLAVPSAVGNDAFTAWFNRMFRVAAGPSGAVGLMRMAAEFDIRNVVSAVRVPTLVFQPQGTGMHDPENGRFLVSVIPDARLVEVRSPDFTVPDLELVWGEIEEFLTGVRRAPAPDRVLATVLFTDIVGSTERAAALGDAGWKRLLDRHDETAAKAVDVFRGRVVKTTGDGILAAFDGPARAIECARQIATAVNEIGIEIRAGLHTGEIELRGPSGEQDIGGIAVHIASRIQGLAGPGEILVSRTVKDLVAGSGIEFDDRGDHELKGVPDRWQVLAVRGE
ncbi:MAG TPA: adenylate/guanylate cyclase domain-containing protein [Acidimicrobiia bacterium]|nr:adenylate/guanylate cyclase domain-containing protein [Acidimicrobiia bacterium]